MSDNSIWNEWAQLNLARDVGSTSPAPEWKTRTVVVSVRPADYALYAAAAGIEIRESGQQSLFDNETGESNLTRLAELRAGMSKQQQESTARAHVLDSAEDGIRKSFYALTKYYDSLPFPIRLAEHVEGELEVEIEIAEYLAESLIRIGSEYGTDDHDLSLRSVCRYAALAFTYGVAVRRWIGIDLWEQILDSCDGECPPVIDPFAGGGAIPLSAAWLRSC